MAMGPRHRGRLVSGSRRRARRGPPARGPGRPARSRRLPSARPRVRGASQPMTLPRSRADAAPVAAIPSPTSACELVLGQGLRAGTRARIAISASSLAARSSRPPPRNASTDSRRVLTSRRQDGQELVVGERVALLLLDVVGGARRPCAGRRGAAHHRRASRRRCRSGCDLEGTPVWHLGRAGHRGRGGPSGGPAGSRAGESG